MNKPLLLLLTLMVTVWGSNRGQSASENILSNFELIKYCLHDYPSNTQVSIALIKNDEISYLGYKKVNDSLYFVDIKDSVFEIASVTKIFTSCIFADLAYHHVFSLDDSINGILPFSLKQSSFNGKPITFKTLLNHTSGLPWDPDNFADDENLNPYAHYNKDLFEDYLRNSMHLTTAPGDTFQYSNTGMALLGYLMEQKTGKTYEELLQEKVFSKYNMISTSTDRNKITNHIIKGLNRTGYILPDGYFGAMAPAGGLLSNASDLASFVKANFRNDSVLAFLRQQTYQANDFRIALGWMMFKFGDTGIPWGFVHEGGTVGYRSSMIVDTDDKLGVVVLSNVDKDHPGHGKISILGYELLKRLYLSQKIQTKIVD